MTGFVETRLLHRANTHQYRENHHASACFVWVKALKPDDTSG